MRNYFSKIALLATLALALTFTFGCPGSLPSPDDGGSAIPGTSVNYNGETYETVKIGTQTWFKRNLNYAVAGSKCYNNLESNCAKYGRLYDWATAMGIDAKYNNQEWGGSDVKHKGICPSGWHIPSNADWDKLYRYVDGSSGTSSPYESPTAGTKLKSRSGWNIYRYEEEEKSGNWKEKSGNGTDDYGFSVLPGGNGNTDGRFDNIGMWGRLWSASEFSNNNAYTRAIGYSDENAFWSPNDKSRWFSVRCVQDSPGTPSGGSVAPPSSSSVPPQSGVTYGPSVTYQGENYQTVVIGTQTWFKRNLNYAVAGSKCYEDLESNCAKYGRLYDWSTAMGIDAKYNNQKWGVSDVKHKGICPSGWHIPNNADWDALSSYVQSNKGCTNCDVKHLKSISSWNNGGNGLDSYGFSALPGGLGNSAGDFYDVGSRGLWWSSSEYGSDVAYGRVMDYYFEDVGYNYYGDKDCLFSVRCVQDSPDTPSSSSVAPSSSSSAPPIVSNCSLNGGSVTIGTQVWMSENLNCNVSGSKCYNNDPSNCAKYGRLYDWATAMGLAASCNSNSCFGQVGAKHRGICPSGWHIPSDADWTTLTDYVGSSAGTKLKATSGWNNNGNGTDTYGFAALPGGYGYSEGTFNDVGNYGNWWSASEFNANFNAIFDANFAYDWYMSYYYENALGYHLKDVLRSVRCVQDSPGTPSSSSVAPPPPPSSSSSVPSSSSAAVVASNCSLNGGTVTIGTQVWMSENLNCNVAGSKCYDNDPSNCAKYGRLYDWSTAMGLNANCNSSTCASQITAKHRGICPSGWHIPSNAEWNALSRYVQNNKGCTSCDAKHLKSTSGWNSTSSWNNSGNGLDSYGFSALPGGYGLGSSFGTVGYGGNWWSASEYGSYDADYLGMCYMDEANGCGIYEGKSFFFSVRCLQD